MKKIWRKDRSGRNDDPAAAGLPRQSFQGISTIDEHPDHPSSTTDIGYDQELTRVNTSSSSSHQQPSNSSSSGFYHQRRILSTKSSRSTLIASNTGGTTNRSNSLSKGTSISSNSISTTSSPASLISPDWDTKTHKCGWLNRANSDFTDDSLKIVRAELKGSQLYIYKTPTDLFNVKNFRYATQAELATASATPSNDINAQSTTAAATAAADSISISNASQLEKNGEIINPLPSPTRPPPINTGASSGTGTGSIDNLDELESLNLGSEDARSLRSKQSFPALQQPQQQQQQVLHTGGSDDMLTHSSSMSMSLSPSKTSMTQMSSSHIIPQVKLTYFSANYPHPNLNIDQSTQAIISGDLESICHSILFNTYIQQQDGTGDNDRVSRHLLSLLPLFGDIVTALAYFKRYSDVFISDPSSHDDYKENQDEQALIPRKTETIMANRLKLVVEYIKDNFPGMLLEDSIFKSVWDLLLSLNVHENCDDLKRQIHSKQQTLYALLNQVEENNTNIIEQEFSAQQFLKMNLQELAQEINKINLRFNRAWNPQSDCSLLFEPIQENYTYYRKSPLIFDSTKNLHYLGRLLINQLFLDSAQSRKSSKRAKVITKWIELGSYFDKIGDMVSWLAIATVICSVPVLRLQKTWDHIDPEIIRTISTDWAPVVFELDRRSMISDAGHRSSYHVIAPQGIGELYPKENVIPYFGDLYVKKPDVLTVKQCERKTQRVIVSLNRWQEYVNKVQNATGVLAVHGHDHDESNINDESTMSDISRNLYSLLNYHISCPALTLDTVMDHSLAVEPSSNGVFNKYHNNSRSPLFLGSYPSVLFPHTLPKYRVYDQKLLMGAIGNETTTVSDNVYHDFKSNIANSTTSTSNSNTGDAAQQAVMAPKIGRNQFLKNVRDIFDIDSCDLHVSDSIIFKTMNAPIEENDLIPSMSSSSHVSDALVVSSPTEDSTSAANISATDYASVEADHHHSPVEESNKTTTNGSRPRSRPSSVLFNESANLKRYSNYSSNLEDFQQQQQQQKQTTTTASQADGSVCEMFTKAASLDRLIDLLILTANIFASEINTDDITNYSKTKSHNNPSFKMDNGVYTVTFFATYRSFCSTTVLLKGLFRRFIGAKSAAISIYKRRQALQQKNSSATQWQVEEISQDYPSWDDTITETHPDYNKVIWKYVAQIQIGILEALLTLIKDHYDHFIDDLDVRRHFVDILKIIDDEVVIEWTKTLSRLEVASQKDEFVEKQLKELHDYHDQILTLYKKLRKVYIKRSYKPVEIEYQSPTFSSTLIQIPKENILPESHDISSIKNFVNEFDELVGILFKRISVNDLLQVFEIIEVQAGKTTTGLFNYQMQSIDTPDKDLVISDVFGWFASLYDDDENNNNDDHEIVNGSPKREYVVNKFPNSVKSIIQIYYKLKTYLVAQITDPTISQDVRVDRMKTVLEMLVFTRDKMESVNLFAPSTTANNSCDLSPHVPSLIESTLVNSIISPESRLFATSWKMASNSFRQEPDQVDIFNTLESLIPAVELHAVINENDSSNGNGSGNNNLSPCIGWLSERLIEIACYIPNMSISNTRLINFDKRRYVYNCISNILDLEEIAEGEAVTNIENFKFLFKLKDDELYPLDEVKKVADLENSSSASSGALFQDMIEEEKQILRKEHSKKAFLTKQEQERKNAAKKESMSSYELKNIGSTGNGNGGGAGSFASVPQGSLTNVTNELRANRRTSMVESPSKSRFKFSLFNRTNRPFAFGGSNPDRIVRNIDLPDAELYNDPKQKPSIVLNLKDTSIFPIYRLPGAFKIDGPNDMEYFFQATSDQEKESWIYELNHARRHWYYSKALNKNISPFIVFGVPIEYVCSRESKIIPTIIDKLISEIEVRGLEEVGIYRKSASVSVLNLLKTEIDKYGDFSMENHLIFDINNATGCIKLYLRELPESLIPDSLIPAFGEVRDENLQFEDRHSIYKKTLPKLPYHNYHLLKRIIHHLKVVDEFSKLNRMTSSNLSTIIGATFTEAANPELTKKYFGLMNFVCEDMIKHYDEIFEHQEK